ncbi:hypothetical protein HZB93_04380 [Candidatus Falkowbacteria bacterium]|nr:hypothetical protein [Candidatus Falkowbacteria bacterium]
MARETSARRESELEAEKQKAERTLRNLARDYHLKQALLSLGQRKPGHEEELFDSWSAYTDFLTEIVEGSKILTEEEMKKISKEEEACAKEEAKLILERSKEDTH